MFGLSPGLVARPYAQPQRYRPDVDKDYLPSAAVDLRRCSPATSPRSHGGTAAVRRHDAGRTPHADSAHPPSRHHAPPHPQHSATPGQPPAPYVPSHVGHHARLPALQHTLNAGAVPTRGSHAGPPGETEGEATAVHLRQRAVVLPSRRAPRRRHSTAARTAAAAEALPPALSSTERVAGSGERNAGRWRRAGDGGAVEQIERIGANTTEAVPATMQSREGSAASPPRRARSSELRDRSTTHSMEPPPPPHSVSATTPAATAAAAATSGGRLSQVLSVGLRGLRASMSVILPATSHGGLYMHPASFEADGGAASAYRRVPPSPSLPTAALRSSSTIVSGRERATRIRQQLSGLSIDEQHAVLRRLRYVPPHSTGDSESLVSCPRSPEAAGRLHPAPTPLSPFRPEEGEEGEAEQGVQWSTGGWLNRSEAAALERWVASLQAAEAGVVPYPTWSQACSVCLRCFQEAEEVAELHCGHLYHFPCIVRWLLRQGSCPCCRADVRRMVSGESG